MDEVVHQLCDYSLSTAAAVPSKAMAGRSYAGAAASFCNRAQRRRMWPGCNAPVCRGRDFYIEMIRMYVISLAVRFTHRANGIQCRLIVEASKEIGKARQAYQAAGDAERWSLRNTHHVYKWT